MRCRESFYTSGGFDALCSALSSGMKYTQTADTIRKIRECSSHVLAVLATADCARVEDVEPYTRDMAGKDAPDLSHHFEKVRSVTLRKASAKKFLTHVACP